MYLLLVYLYSPLKKKNLDYLKFREANSCVDVATQISLDLYSIFQSFFFFLVFGRALTLSFPPLLINRFVFSVKKEKQKIIITFFYSIHFKFKICI